MKRRELILTFISFSIISFIIFFPALSAGFVSDDWHWLWTAHQQTSVIPNLLENATGDIIGGSYNPLSSLWVNSLYALFNLKPLAYHIASIFLHVATSIAVSYLFITFTKLFKQEPSSQTKKYALVAGLLFLVWPTHVEAVAWISSIPHVLATFFVTISLLAYLKGRETKKPSFYIGSLCASLLALFSKETALILPLLILLIEIFSVVTKRTNVTKQLLLYWTGIALSTITFLMLRFNATGLLFGSYAEQTFIVRPKVWLHTFLTFFEEMFTLGLVRAEWSILFFNNAKLAAIAILVVGTVILGIMLHKRAFKILLLSSLFFATLLPFILLGFNRLTADGERYTYLTSIIFIILIVWLASRIKKTKLVLAFMLGLVLVSGILVFNKSKNWKRSGEVANSIINSIPEIAKEIPDTGLLVFVGLPDTVGGAHAMRNNLFEAVVLTNSFHPIPVVRTQAFTQPSRKHSYENMLAWETDERGGFLKSVSEPLLITGNARFVTDEATYELWGYDYSLYSTDQIRILLTDTFKDNIQDGKSKMYTWNNNQLEELEWTGN